MATVRINITILVKTSDELSVSEFIEVEGSLKKSIDVELKEATHIGDYVQEKIDCELLGMEIDNA